MKIVIAGYGYVGKAISSALKDTCDITIVDPAFSTLTVKDTEPDAVIICVSTPQSEDGTCDVSNVIQVINDTPKEIPILIKSTISLEGWDRILKCKSPQRITFSPEFLRARTAIEDFKNQKIMYVGHGATTYWADTFLKSNPNLDIQTYEVKQLILAKYFRNAFLATKVSFFNQVLDLCKASGVSFDEVREVITDDNRIGKSHSGVTEQRGIGGHCFPKDVSAIIETGVWNNVDLSIINEASEYNTKIRYNEIEHFLFGDDNEI